MNEEKDSDKLPTIKEISDKLQKIVDYMQGNNGVITQAEVANMFGVSDRQARNNLSSLLTSGRVIAIGANKNRIYTLKGK